MPSPSVVVLGAGPAGLTAAYELAKAGVASTVLEADDTVGGLSRTAEYKGYRFDIGGHRFFTKVTPVEELWIEILGDDLLTRPRLSRIYYNGKFFSYPLKPFNALFGLGIFESTRCVASYGWARLFPKRPEEDFASWISNRFGKRLFEVFFNTYTEKVWGIPCSEIQAEWAAQRIKGLSLMTALKNALIGDRSASKQDAVKTLINQFLYPRHGPGMMWEKAQELVEGMGSRVLMEQAVNRVFWSEGKIDAVEAGGQTYAGEHFISSVAIRELIESFEPAPPENVIAAARKLKYRDFLTVALMVRGESLFPDNWIYIHEPGVKLGRLQNFKNWSPEMVPDPAMTGLGLEYFCSEGDELWSMTDAELVELGKREIVELGFTTAADITDGTVVRMKKAYPVYDRDYAPALETIRAFLATLSNLQLIGRNGMHRYNNQDHSMLTAMLAARNILGAKHDLWQVNVDEEYHEQGRGIKLEDVRELDSTQPLVPRKLAE